MFHELTLGQWIERKKNSERILRERQAEVSIMEADVRHCERMIRELSGYDRMAATTSTSAGKD